MSDAIDTAQAVEEADRARALASARQRIADSFAPRTSAVFDGVCIECEQPIEPARLRALGPATSRCATCAHDFERAMRRPR